MQAALLPLFSGIMDEDLDNLFSALYKALDRLEELDPDSCKEEWFKLIERSVDRALQPYVKKAMELVKH